ncbi:uncharacterized protein LOC122498151 [Leptopilina heterotoma]|uniref:uncharacterized protein LOC122498151 n=1 Tax=Leptopilina heterotoma TaxID=63436 RepID=UPI001CA9BB4B|nr:uncharacterized protein LOC122498151 [Leptopilina heterotoma]
MFCILLLAICVATGDTLRLAAYISSGGLHGEIHFLPGNVENVKIRFSLKTTLQYPDQLWEWYVTQFPVDYTSNNDRCGEQNLGKSVIDLTEKLGPLQMPGNETGSIEVPGLSFTGENGLWGKGLIFKDAYSSRIICASIMVLNKNSERVAEARFHNSVGGSVWFRWLGGQAGENITETVIYSNLHRVDQLTPSAVDYTEHNWKIYVTDIFEPGSKDKSNCNILQAIFDPDNAGVNKSIGDIDMRLGKIKISENLSKRRKYSFRDPKLDLLPNDFIGSHRLLYLVIFHPTHTDSFLACAKIEYRKPVMAKAIINAQGVKGEVSFNQESPFAPTWLNISLNPINDLETRLRYETRIAAYKIHELPEEPAKFVEPVGESCTTTKKMYNPINIDDNTLPPPGFGTQDQYAIGDLSGKLQNRKEGSMHFDILDGSSKLSGVYWDTNLPLSGSHSVIHRSLVLHKYNESDNKSISPWVCAVILHHSPKNTGPLSLTTAQVIFRYPLVGRIIFRQPTDEPEMDTTILIEHLVHADGTSLNNSAEHRWMIHDFPPGKDYYNWTARCLSAGAPFNPYKIESGLNQPSQCSANEITLCRLGDLTRLGSLEIAGRKSVATKLTRKLFTDSAIHLSGPNSIIGKSLVIYDDHGPKARGERLACSIISRVYRRKAVVRNWFSSSEPKTAGGKIEFIQQTEYDLTNVEVNLEGLSKLSSGYHIHMTPIEMDLEFPCEESSLYGHWNPLKVDPKNVPLSEEGTTDQYEMGDLSGKFGTLDNRNRYSVTYNDTMLPLFGPRSILGRSVVIHKKEKNIRWSCSTIERGYAPSEARELRAIASFHHPDGYAYGYIRLTQLIYKDNSQSETAIEVKLRHPGENDRNITRNHNWAIYVNPVGVDASVKVKDTRCVAAGYIWNPYFTQLADPINEDLYKQECGADLPLRCYVGDISARLGPIDIGLERRVFSDSNFPLEGPVSAMGKSIVIMEKDFGNTRFACANIEPDHDIVKYINIKRTPRFVVAQFLETVREVMGVPDWMISVDSRKTKILHSGGCIQFLLHFRGPIANKLDQDFGKLISTGKLETTSLYIPGYVPKRRKGSFGYQQCGFRDPNEKKKKNFFFQSNSSTLHPHMFVILLIGLLSTFSF